MNSKLAKSTLFIFVGGEDGGIGKSTLCTLLAEYLLAKQEAFCLVDANRLKKDVKAKYEGQQEQELITFEDIIFSESSKRDTEANLLYDVAAEEGRNILVNLPAEIHEIFINWLVTNDILEIAPEDQVDICYFHVSSGTKENLNSFQQVLDFFAGKAQVFLVKNEYKCENWQIFEAAEKRLLKSGGKSLILPALHSKYKEVIDQNNLSWSQAGEYEDTQKGYRKIARNNVKKFVKRFCEQLDELNLISPTETIPRKEEPVENSHRGTQTKVNNAKRKRQSKSSPSNSKTQQPDSSVTQEHRCDRLPDESKNLVTEALVGIGANNGQPTSEKPDPGLTT